jgi:hypothetical protein
VKLIEPSASRNRALRTGNSRLEISGGRRNVTALRAWWNGRHARLRIWSRKGWRFKSSRAHHFYQKNVTACALKPLLLAMLLVAALLTGCASRQYVVTLNNGRRVVAAEKPHLEGFNFVFTDLNGRTNSIPSVRVRAVEPDSSRPPAR